MVVAIVIIVVVECVPTIRVVIVEEIGGMFRTRRNASLTGTSAGSANNIRGVRFYGVLHGTASASTGVLFARSLTLFTRRMAYLLLFARGGDAGGGCRGRGGGEAGSLTGGGGVVVAAFAEGAAGGYVGE